MLDLLFGQFSCFCAVLLLMHSFTCIMAVFIPRAIIIFPCNYCARTVRRSLPIRRPARVCTRHAMPCPRGYYTPPQSNIKSWECTKLHLCGSLCCSKFMCHSNHQNRIHHCIVIQHYITVYVLEVDDLLLDNLLFLSSLASFALFARSLAYSAASARDFSPALRLRESRCLFRCRRTGVISRWILGALYRWGFPSFCGSGLLMMYCRTSSSFVRL